MPEKRKRIIAKTLEEAKNIWEEIPWGRTSHYKGEEINGLIFYYRTINNNLSNNHPKFVVKCTCGNFFAAQGTHIKTGNTTSCGCKNIQRLIDINKETKRIDITNQRFGHLVALEPIDDEEISKKTNGAAWKCKCDCGNICYLGSATLKYQKTCGQKTCIYSYAKIDLTNYEDENFKVLKIDSDNTKNDAYWICECKHCGKILSKRSIEIRNKRALSCGCLNMSKGENKIAQILSNNNIIFEKEKTFSDLSFLDNPKSHPRFDFYVDNRYCIEFDGIQHFKYIENTWFDKLNFEIIQEHDKIKNQYCFDNNIPIIRIPYWHLNSLCLEDLLLETSQFIVKKEIKNEL